VNKSQIDYETNLKDEARMLHQWFGLAVAASVQRKPVQEGLGKRKSVELILNQFRACAPNNFVILGIVRIFIFVFLLFHLLGLTNMNEKNRAFGHAIAFRSYKVAREIECRFSYLGYRR
jgi:hypothetical protein